MKITKTLVIIIITFLVMASCRKIQHLSPVPYIEFTSFTIFDTVDILGNANKAGKLKFYFEDGDGDIGLDQPSSDQNDTTNLFLKLFRKVDGNMVEVTDKYDPLLPYSSYRIPYLDRQGQNKILKGTISVTFLYQSYSAGDTINYDFYIKDRAQNESNTASTTEIVVSSNDIYSR